MFLNLLEGRFDIDPEIIDLEVFTYKGKAYAYFSMFPAFLRGPFHLFMDIEKTSLARISCITANITSLVFQVMTGVTIHNVFAKSVFRKVLFACFLICLLLSGPHLFLMAYAPVYHEVILWAAVCASIVNYFFLSRIFTEKEFGLKTLLVMATASGICVHNRVPVAIALYLITLLSLFIFAHKKELLDIKKAKEIIKSKEIMFPLLIMLFFGLLSFAINYARWENPFKFANYDGYEYINKDESRKGIFDQYGLFNVSRIPESISYYMTGSYKLDKVLSSFVTTGFDGKEVPRAAKLLMSPFMLCMSLFGILCLLRREKDKKKNFLRLSVCFHLITVILMLCFMYVSLRYRMDLQPFFFLTAFTGLYYMLEKSENYSALTNKTVIALSIITTLSSVFFSHITMVNYKFNYHFAETPMDAINFVNDYYFWTF